MKLDFKKAKRKLFGNSPGKSKKKRGVRSGSSNDINIICVVLIFAFLIAFTPMLLSGVDLIETNKKTTTTNDAVEDTDNQESVLGLRKFKETVTPVLLSEAPSSSEEYYNVNFIEVEPVYNSATDSNTIETYVYGYTPIFSVDGGATFKLVMKSTIGAEIKDTGFMYLTVDFTSDMAETFEATVIATANTTVDAWLLANTEPVETESTVLGVTGLYNNESGALTLTDDAANVAAYSTTTDGEYVSVTNDLDNYFPFNQIEEFTDENGNVFVKYPQLWMKWDINDEGFVTGYKFADHQIDDSYFVPDAFLDPRDLTGNTYLEYFALGKYEMSGTAEQGFSKSGQTVLTNITRDQARIAARSYGSADNYYNGYQQLDIAQYSLFNLMAMMYFQTMNIQNVYVGRTDFTSEDGAAQTGTTDGVTGLNGWNTTTHCTKILGIEGAYDNVAKWVDGFNNVHGVAYVHRYPQYYADDIENATELGFALPTDIQGIVSGFKNGTGNNNSFIFAASVMASESAENMNLYTGDFCYHPSGIECGVLFVGGFWYGGSGSGLWCAGSSRGASAAVPSIGARLSYRPL